MRLTIMKISAAWHRVNGVRRSRPTEPLDERSRTGRGADMVFLRLVPDRVGQQVNQPARASPICVPSAGRPTAWQRLLSFTSRAQTHADHHQAVLRPCDHSPLECRRCGRPLRLAAKRLGGASGVEPAPSFQASLRLEPSPRACARSARASSAAIVAAIGWPVTSS